MTSKPSSLSELVERWSGDALAGDAGMEQAYEACIEDLEAVICTHEGRTLKPSEVLLPYPEFEKLTHFKGDVRSTLCKCTQAWLGEWELWDLAVSPIDDDERRFTRYGWWLGRTTATPSSTTE